MCEYVTAASREASGNFEVFGSTNKRALRHDPSIARRHSKTCHVTHLPWNGGDGNGDANGDGDNGEVLTKSKGNVSWSSV